MNLICKIKIKDAWNAKYKILRIWILVGILFQFIPWKLPFYGARYYQEKGRLLSAVNYRTLAKKYIPSALSPMSNDWCVEYRFVGLDGGRGGIICGEKKLIKIFGPTDRCYGNENPLFGYCDKYQESSDSLVSFGTYSDDDLKLIRSGEFMNLFNRDNLTPFELELKRKVSSQMRIIRIWGNEFNDETDWKILTFHHGRFSFLGHILAIFFTLLSNFLIPIFLIFLMLFTKYLFKAIRKLSSWSAGKS